MGTLRARVFTGWRRAVPLGFGLLLAVLVIVLMAVGLFGLIVLGIGIALGWTALGYALWSERG